MRCAADDAEECARWVSDVVLPDVAESPPITRPSQPDAVPAATPAEIARKGCSVAQAPPEHPGEGRDHQHETHDACGDTDRHHGLGPDGAAPASAPVRAGTTARRRAADGAGPARGSRWPRTSGRRRAAPARSPRACAAHPWTAPWRFSSFVLDLVLIIPTTTNGSRAGAATRRGESPLCRQAKAREYCPPGRRDDDRRDSRSDGHFRRHGRRRRREGRQSGGIDQGGISGATRLLRDDRGVPAGRCRRRTGDDHRQQER